MNPKSDVGGPKTAIQIPISQQLSYAANNVATIQYFNLFRGKNH